MEDNFVEYFVCSNPPLLPRGVREVIEASKHRLAHVSFAFTSQRRLTWSSLLTPPSKLFENDFVEILYEPEAAWFKCTSRSDIQDQVTDVLQNLLHHIIFSETELKDCRQGSNAKTTADLQAIASNPRVVPWATYCDGKIDMTDDYLYPDHLTKYRHKAVWRGLENTPEYGVDDLLMAAAYFWNDTRSVFGDQDAADLEWFGKILCCEASPNLSHSTVYIAGDEIENVEKAVESLDNIAKAMVSPSSSVVKLVLGTDPVLQNLFLNPEHSRNFIATESGGHVKLAYRYLSHVGLDKSTLISPGSPDSASEYVVILNHAATLRTVKETKEGGFIVDLTKYPHPSIPKPDVSKTLAAFEDYKFKPKAGKKYEGVVRGQNALVERSTKKPQATASPKQRDSTHKVSDWVDRLPVHEDLISFDAEVEPNPQYRGGTDGLGTTQAAAITSAAALDHTQSQAAVVDLGPGLNSLPQGLTADPGALQTELPESSYDSPLPEGLTSLWDILEPECRRDPAQHDEAEDLLVDEPVVFGIKEDPPKDLHVTMNQKSGRATSHTGTSSQSPVTEKTATLGASALDELGTLSLGGFNSQKGHRGYQHRDELLAKLETEAEKLAMNLQWVPGRVRMELKFGRLYFESLLESQINTGTGPQWDVLELWRALKEERKVGFQSILSSSGEDGDALLTTELEGQFPWEMDPLAKRVFFHFNCVLEKGKSRFPFIIKIDAESMEYRCQGLTEEISSISIHCPQRAWDMRLCAERTRIKGLPTECKAFARSLVECLKVS